ncbi:hypothetical protein [Altererythrobacter sp. Root672]|uniref:hypothetical protein n=1 Tax=Altererythrobacter sp. Root672 TaxID=1736584 RepID=UPI0006FD745A|nr:hypothetical protein [Altererythrobacter sp. Root672]KRA80466.1 hypothetical protein ASD76_14955 [Altererythrobacter sp. Root672]
MKEPYGMTVFCDDIRDEVSNKKTYVGVYAGEMIVGDGLPAMVPSLGLAIKYLEPFDMPVQPVSIRVFAPGEGGDSEVLVDVELPADRPQRPLGNQTDPLAEFRAHMLDFRFSPLLIKAEGHIKVRAYVGDEEKEIRLGSLRIRKLTSEDGAHSDQVQVLESRAKAGKRATF